MKTLERESALKLKETTVTHNSVFAAANCTSTKCRFASEARSGISFSVSGLGSAGCQPAGFGSLPATVGWPALPRLQSPIYHLPSSIFDFLGGIAQLVERQLCKLEVRGSNPLASSLRSQRSGARSLSRQPCRRRTIFTALSTPGELHFPFLCEFFLIKACLLKYRNQQPISIVPADFV